MAKIVRTPTKATGGITKAERVAMETHAALWAARAFRTEPIDHQKITDAIVALYAAANMEKPQVVVVPSPLVMAFAYGAAATCLATGAATRAAVSIAAYAATDEATYAATDVATRIATDEATRAAIRDAALEATYLSTRDAVYLSTRDAVYLSTRDTDDVAILVSSNNATRNATSDATRDATHYATLNAVDSTTRSDAYKVTEWAVSEVTYAATRAAVHGATFAATNTAIRASMYGASNATHRATNTATRSGVQGAAYNATAAVTDYATRIATRKATHDATRKATHDATRNATDLATYIATDSTTRQATYDATRVAARNITNDATRDVVRDTVDSVRNSINAADDSTFGAIFACNELGGHDALVAAAKWPEVYQGGNMWAPYECYLTAMRDIIGLQLPEHEKYIAWETAAIEGGFRVMHEKFCLVSDFPEIIKIDDNNRPHCADGPSHRWRDGWSLYHWHGVAVPPHWIEFRDELSASEVLKEQNLEKRRAGCEIVGWPKMLKQLGSKMIDRDEDPEIGELLEVKLPDLSRPARFLRVRCGTGREFMIGVPPDMQTALDAQAWMVGLSTKDFRVPEVRT